MAITYVRELSIKELAKWHMWDAPPKLA